MATTLEVILEDFSKVKRRVTNVTRTVTLPPARTLKALLKGAVTGAVLPIAPRTSVSLYASLGGDDAMCRTNYEFISYAVSYVVGVSGVLGTAIYFGREHPLELVGAVAVTHALDYVNGARLRANKRTEKERAQQSREYRENLAKYGSMHGDIDIG